MSENDLQSERDEFYDQVLDFAESQEVISIAAIQNEFKIGYVKAAKIMSDMEKDGVVGPPLPSKSQGIVSKIMSIVKR